MEQQSEVVECHYILGLRVHDSLVVLDGCSRFAGLQGCLRQYLANPHIVRMLGEPLFQRLLGGLHLARPPAGNVVHSSNAKALHLARLLSPFNAAYGTPGTAIANP